VSGAGGGVQKDIEAKKLTENNQQRYDGKASHQDGGVENRGPNL